MEVKRCTAKAPVNIAVVKYWGKKNEKLIIPLNDSISITLSPKVMCATTTVACSPLFTENRIFLNGREESADNPRLLSCLEKVRRTAKSSGDISFLEWPVHICSENNFPTAAGLASSAAGYACLVYALASLYGIKGDLSVIARLGSGSACRSIHGGFVHWETGILEDGSDSRAKQIIGEDHWPDLRVLILVVNSGRKKTSSSVGMKESVKSSGLIHYRSTVVVPQRIEEITSAILKKNFETFGMLTMKDSNQFHAVCLDTYPPLCYLNSTSFAIMEFVHAYNDYYGQVKLAYTFDAGPNACLFMKEEDEPEVLALIKHLFPSSDSLHVHGLHVPEVPIPQTLAEFMKLETKRDALQFIISTEVGGGPELVTDPSQHLLSEQGLPINI